MNREVYSRTEKTKDIWETPDYFFNLLDNYIFKKFKRHFTLDPCASVNNTKCKKFYTKIENGLNQSWIGEIVFVNPPFSHIEDWVKKCYEESLKSKTIVVMIIPSRTDTQYWHKYIMKANEIMFCVGRVNFLLNGKKPKNSSTFPLSIIIFKHKIFRFFLPKISSFHHKHMKKRGLNKESNILVFL